jgi:Arc-like DNA binding dprotein
MAKKSGSKSPAAAYLEMATAALKRPGRGSDQFIVRLPDGMRELIAEMAERHGRSMNAEIVNALAHQILRFSPGKHPDGMVEVMNDAMAERILRGEVQHAVREMGRKLEALAKELDQMAAGSRTLTKEKEEKPAGGRRRAAPAS